MLKEFFVFSIIATPQTNETHTKRNMQEKLLETGQKNGNSWNNESFFDSIIDTQQFSQRKPPNKSSQLTGTVLRQNHGEKHYTIPKNDSIFAYQ